MTESESEREGRRGREGERKERERLIWRCYLTGFEDEEAISPQCRQPLDTGKAGNGFFAGASRRNAALLLGQSVSQFSCSVVSDSLRPHESQHARPLCPSPTPGVHSDSHPSSQWCHPAISSSVVSFSSCPQSLPASESFPMSQLTHEVAKVSTLASFLPKNTQDWFPLDWHEVKWSEVTPSCPTLCDPMDYSLQGSSVHGIFQARVLEWVAVSFSRTGRITESHGNLCLAIWGTVPKTVFQGGCTILHLHQQCFECSSSSTSSPMLAVVCLVLLYPS